jgi:chromate transport protein ChrA
MHRTYGGIVAGVLFVLPSFIFILVAGPLVESTHDNLNSSHL